MTAKEAFELANPILLQDIGPYYEEIKTAANKGLLSLEFSPWPNKAILNELVRQGYTVEATAFGRTPEGIEMGVATVSWAPDFT